MIDKAHMMWKINMKYMYIHIYIQGFECDESLEEDSAISTGNNPHSPNSPNSPINNPINNPINLLLLASDVFYFTSQAEPFWQTIHTLLTYSPIPHSSGGGIGEMITSTNQGESLRRFEQNRGLLLVNTKQHVDKLKVIIYIYIYYIIFHLRVILDRVSL